MLGTRLIGTLATLLLLVAMGAGTLAAPQPPVVIVGPGEMLYWIDVYEAPNSEAVVQYVDADGSCPDRMTGTSGKYTHGTRAMEMKRLGECRFLAKAYTEVEWERAFG